MKCPMCAAWSNVIETRNHRRRRECGNGHRFTTQEVVIANARSDAAKQKYEQMSLQRDSKGRFIG